jgi:hypothetical protein
MTLKYSTGARQFMASYGSFKDAFQNGHIEIYTGAQPATADDAATGTLLCTITDASAARTSEVLANGSLTLNTGAAGSVDTLTVNGVDILGGPVVFNVSLNQTAADCVVQIETLKSAVEYEVTVSGAVITIRALPGTGATSNGFVVAATYTTIVGTTANLSGGVTAINGLHFLDAVAGVVNKVTLQSWSGVNAATGTAGWYRFYGSIADTGGLDATGLMIREDGAIALAVAELTMPSLALAATVTTTISAWTRTITTA